MEFVYVVIFIAYPSDVESSQNIEKVFRSKEKALKYAESKTNHFVQEWLVSE